MNNYSLFSRRNQSDKRPLSIENNGNYGEFDPVIKKNKKISKLWNLVDNCTVKQNDLLISHIPSFKIFQMMQEIVFQVDTKGYFIYVNNYFLSLFHYTEEDLLGHHILDYAHPDDIPAVQERFPLLLQGELVHQIVGRYRMKNGNYIHLSGNIVPILNQFGKVESMFGILQNISKQKELEQQLRETQKRFHAITNQNFMGINITQDGLTRYQNAGTTQITGYSPEDRAKWGKDENLSMIHPEDQARIIDQFNLDQNNTNSDPMKCSSYRIITKSGEVKSVDDYSKLISFNGRDAWLSMLLDISEKRHLQEEYFKNQKIESVGILAGGIAHDFNNLLTSILGNISLAKIEVGDQHHPLTEILGEAEKAANQAAQLTKQLLAFSKGGAPVKESTAIVPVIQDTTQFVLRGSNLQPRFEIASDIPMIYADSGQISQVIQNLVLNAKQAMPTGGKITISIEKILGIKWKSKIGIDTDRKYVEIIVADEGAGISPDHLSKIFDPYFTTKKSGSGLGLAISDSIVKKHSGIMWVESKLGHGAKFYLLLPAINGVSNL